MQLRYRYIFSTLQEEILEKTLMVASANGNKPSLYESLRHTNAASLLENLQSQLKQREGEIIQLQVGFLAQFINKHLNRHASTAHLSYLELQKHQWVEVRIDPVIFRAK